MTPGLQACLPCPAPHESFITVRSESAARPQTSMNSPRWQGPHPGVSQQTAWCPCLGGTQLWATVLACLLSPHPSLEPVKLKGSFPPSADYPESTALSQRPVLGITGLPCCLAQKSYGCQFWATQLIATALISQLWVAQDSSVHPSWFGRFPGVCLLKKINGRERERGISRFLSSAWMDSQCEEQGSWPLFATGLQAPMTMTSLINIDAVEEPVQ